MPFFETSDGIRLYYEQWGVGDVCLVVDPGWVGSVEIWADLYRPLVRLGLPVLAYEARGCGRSDRPDPTPGNYALERLALDSFELVDHLGLGRRIALGRFDGARVALRHAVERPDEIAGLILNAPALSTPTSNAMYVVFRELLQTGDFPTVIRQLIAMSSPGWTDEERAEYVELLRDCTTTAIGEAVWDGLVRVDDHPLLERVRCPALVIGGRQQVVPDPEQVAAVSERLPEAELAELESTAVMPRPGINEGIEPILAFARKHGILAT